MCVAIHRRPPKASPDRMAILSAASRPLHVRGWDRLPRSPGRCASASTAAIGRTLVGHTAEDVVGGAVDDPADPVDPVAAQGLLERFDDRECHRRRRLRSARTPRPQRRPLRTPAPWRAITALFAVTTDLPAAIAAQDQGAGRLNPAHHLHNYLNIHASADRRSRDRSSASPGGRIDRARHAPDRAQPRASRFKISDQRVTTLRGLARIAGHPAAHRAEAKQADADPCTPSRAGPPSELRFSLEL